MKRSCHGMTLHYNIWSIVGPRHGVACNFMKIEAEALLTLTSTLTLTFLYMLISKKNIFIFALQ
jgi:hypothetical protein